MHWRWCFLRCNWAVAPQPDPLLEGGGPKGRGILIAEGGSFGASSPKELARRERTTLLAGSTPYDIWELPFQGLPSAARPDLRISPLRVIGRLRSEADAMEAQRAFKATFPTAGRDASLEPLFGSFLADQKGTPRRIGEWRLRS